MNLNKYLFFLSFLYFLSISTYSQNVSEEFKPSGKVIATTFFDYSTGLNSNSNESGFDISRALLGYKYKFHPKFEATVSVDAAAGRSVDDNVEVYLRNAYFSWTEGSFNLKVGLTNMTQFSLQQSVWGHRYAYKSLQDFIGMGHSVDLGVVAKYNFSPILSADFSLTNGEGNKVIRKDKSVKYALGVTVEPIKNLYFRAYTDIYTKDTDRLKVKNPEELFRNQITYSLFAGYKNTLFSAGLEFNKQLEVDNIKGNDLSTISVYSTININPKWNTYVRYDYSDSSSSSNDQLNWFDDNQAIIAGVEFKPYKFLKLSPNFRNYNYDKSSSEQYIFLSGEFTF